MNIYAHIILIGCLIGACLFFAAVALAVAFSAGERDGICKYGYTDDNESEDE